MVKKLIINADDFGLTEGVNQAVIECYQRGVVSSATLLVTGGAAKQAGALAGAHKKLGVGLHLNLTSGEPVLPPASIKSLVGNDGHFPGLASAVMRLTTGWARGAELEAEIAAQIERCLKLGIVPTHIDSHHHLHAHPRLRRIITRVCGRMGINKARGYHMGGRSPKALVVRAAAAIPATTQALKTPERFFGIEVMGKKDFTDALGEEMSAARGTLEFMCHPGYVDRDLEEVSSFSGPRQAELEALLKPSFKEMINASGVKLISYREL